MTELPDGAAVEPRLDVAPDPATAELATTATEPATAELATAPPEPGASSATVEPVVSSAPGAAPPEPAAPAPRRPRPGGTLQLAVAIVALLAGAALFLSGFSLGARTATTPGTPASEAQLFGPFWDVWDSITKSYVGEVDQEKLVQGAIDGMIGALDDPYSAYMSPEELQKARESIGGEFSGVGAEVSTQPTEDGVESCDTPGRPAGSSSWRPSTGRRPSAPACGPAT